jgi:hypothetical protein
MFQHIHQQNNVQTGSSKRIELDEVAHHVHRRVWIDIQKDMGKFFIKRKEIPMPGTHVQDQRISG